MPDLAKTTGYTPALVASLLKSQNSHPTLGDWRRNKVLHDLEYYVAEIVWTTASNATDVAGEPIPPLTRKSAVPRGMQGLFRKLQSFNARNCTSLPSIVAEHFQVANKARLEELSLEVTCTFSGLVYLFKLFP